MMSALSVWAQYLLPQRLLASCVYRIARSTKPAVKNALIRWFARHFNIDLTEAEQPDLGAYESFNAFFTRALRNGARPIAGDEKTLVSPADGTLSEFGVSAPDRLIEAKGIGYGLNDLLGETTSGETTSGETDLAFGTFATIYLAPHNYHRVHMPLSGTLARTRYIPGRRFSVNSATVEQIPGLFCRNERALCWFDTAIGPMVIALIGALNVSSITTEWLGEIPSGEQRLWQDHSSPRRYYDRGDEIARFNLGSTVVLLLPSASLQWETGLSAPRTLRVGEALGTHRGGG
ncbi:MAG: archaetidylserine decarboxylase [Gammaproteobacteria bacterium]